MSPHEQSGGLLGHCPRQVSVLICIVFHCMVLQGTGGGIMGAWGGEAWAAHVLGLLVDDVFDGMSAA